MVEFAVWSENSTDFTITNNGLTATNSASGWRTAIIDMPLSPPCYFEIVILSVDSNFHPGVCELSFDLAYTLGSSAASYSYKQSGTNGGSTYNNSSYTVYGDTFTADDVIGIAISADGKIWFSKNDVWQNSGNPATGANPAYTGLTGDKYGAFTVSNASYAATLRSSPADFTGTVPAGFTGGIFIPSNVDEITSGIGFSITASAFSTSAIKLNSGIGFSISIAAATQPVATNVGIGFGANMAAYTQPEASCNVGIGFSSSVAILPWRAIQGINIGIGFNNAVTIAKQSENILNCKIGFSAQVTGNISNGIIMNAGIGFSNIIDIDNDGDTEATCSLPAYSSDRWC